MTFPSNFIANIKAAYGERGNQWLQDLPKKIEELCNHWDCQFIQPMPELSYGFVGIVESNSSKIRMVLKMSPPGGPIPSEIKWLNHFVGLAPSIVRTEEGPKEGKTAFLMEECKPGHSVKQIIDTEGDETATRIICEMIRGLHSQPHSDLSFKHLSELIPDLSSLSGIADPVLVSKAMSLFTDLTQDRSNDVLLHGDLHHDNIIRHGEAWKVIDPHGYMGDPASESGPLIYNPIDSFPKDRSLSVLLENRLSVMTDHLPYDSKRVRAWAFCKTMLSAAWFVQDFKDLKDLKGEAKKQLEIARALHAITP